ncbi:hypothetical protein [Falsibacillus pallidus]|uniref:Uncharacterized protein n=1 Tax=Falsibacillus pallidus TaxID=493781 RepID=A0A370GCW1_9BACI|nr:hypothetical protein [Falsibacillus pallidus]RDI40909.1 hypothetical protein DFR59_11152 [Falsibacillus pallidus]
MTKLIKVQKAKDEIKRLQHYINLVESYEVNSLERWIIKEYAYTNSIIEVVRRANIQKLTYEGLPLDKKFATAVLKAKATDELHLIMQRGYKHRIKMNKGRPLR